MRLDCREGGSSASWHDHYRVNERWMTMLNERWMNDGIGIKLLTGLVLASFVYTRISDYGRTAVAPLRDKPDPPQTCYTAAGAFPEPLLSFAHATASCC
jgi:hypothetical protein